MLIILASIAGSIALLFAIILFIFMTPRDRSVLLQRPHTFEQDGADRTYRLVEPKKITKDTKLIVGIHGFGDRSQWFAYYTALHNADPDAVVVYPDALPPPDGLKTGWNASFCCGSGWVTKTDDVTFITSLAEALRDQFGIQNDKVFVTGFSNGAFMAQRLGAERPDVFKAIAVSSGSVGTTTNQLSIQQPIPILLMHGEKDGIVPFDGGEGSSDPDFEWVPFSKTVEVWQKNNGRDAPVEVVTYPENKHQWNDWRLFNVWHKVPEASTRVVNFFESN